MSKFVGIVVVGLGCYAISCMGGVKYLTSFKGMADPEFRVQDSKTIWFTPQYYSLGAQRAGISELSEKQIYAHFKREFEARGYSVRYIPMTELTVTADSFFLKDGLPEYPDLVFSIAFGRSYGEITVPAQYAKETLWGKEDGYGYSVGHGEYQAPVWTMWIGVTVWAEGPKYNRRVWIGAIRKGRPIDDFSDISSQMVGELLTHQNFPRKVKPSK